LWRQRIGQLPRQFADLCCVKHRAVLPKDRRHSLPERRGWRISPAGDNEETYVRLVLLFLLITVVFASDIYSWRDANGVRHFGEKPPENAIDLKKHAIDNHLAPALNDDQSDHIKNSQNLLRAYDEERAERSAQKAQKKMEQKQREQRCAQVKKELDFYQNSSRRVVRDDKGNERELSPAEDRDYHEKLREAAKALCQ
jgi:hypothetical protein